MAGKSLTGALRGLVFCAAAAALWGAPAARGQAIQQFDIYAWDGMTLGPDGSLWFGSYGGIGRLDASRTLTQFDIPGNSATSLIFGITPGSDGNLWFTQTDSPAIGRITPSGTVTVFPLLPPPSSQPFGITSGPDGNLWYTDQARNQIGRITPSGAMTGFPVPTPSAGLSGIAAGTDGDLWFAEASGNRIGRITTLGLVTEFALPTAGSRPTAVAADSDGNIWFTESRAARVGRITPAGVITEFPSTFGSAGVVFADGHMWFTASGTITRMSLDGDATPFPAPLFDPSPLGLVAGTDGALWTTDNVNGFWGQIVRFAPDTSACVADATTLCLDNGRFRVRADWNSGDGSTGHGRGVNLTANAGYFWFFDAANIEMVVKVLDGCSSNQHHWAFAAGLTNVEVTTTVTDTYTGLSKTYTNPQGTPFAPIQDTAAFAACQ